MLRHFHTGTYRTKLMRKRRSVSLHADARLRLIERHGLVDAAASKLAPYERQPLAWIQALEGASAAREPTAPR